MYEWGIREYLARKALLIIFFLSYRFKQSASGLLLATDVAARGLDIPAVEHVIHYQVPKDPDVSSSQASGSGNEKGALAATLNPLSPNSDQCQTSPHHMNQFIIYRS